MAIENIPFPIRQKGDSWEVAVIFEGEFNGYILCDSQEKAEAIADIRPLLNISRCGQRCPVERVRRCADAVRYTALAQTFAGRMLMDFEKRMSDG